MNTGKITAPFRQIGLMHLLDKGKFYAQKLKNAKKNNRFLKQYPQVKLPPDYMMFESYRLDYHKYYFGGEKSAIWIKENATKYLPLKQKTLLDWGCGPARILRHLPNAIGNDCQFYGTDYNEKTIAWCKENIPSINFKVNQLNPPLNYPSNTFDFIYGISIFTHLSKENHSKWLEELIRVTKKDGIILLTTAGAAFKEIMTEQKRILLTKGN